MDHFKDFKGFGTEGTYVGCFRESILDVAERILKMNRGQRVVLRYHESARTHPLKGDILSKFHEDWIKVPMNGALDDFFGGIRTDNIEIEVDGNVLELQVLVVQGQEIVELRQHDIKSDYMRDKLGLLKAYRNV